MYRDDDDGGGGGWHAGGKRVNISYDGKRMRAPVIRKTIDHNSSVIHYLNNRHYIYHHAAYPYLHPTVDDTVNLSLHPLLPATPSPLPLSPAHALLTKYISQCVNKVRCAVTTVRYLREGRRIICGAVSGELTLWNALTFNFETILNAHDDAVRAMCAPSNIPLIITADEGGVIKYWQPSLNNLKAFKAHKQAVRDVSTVASQTKLLSASDDQTISLWDIETCVEERSYRGHGWDVKAVSAHPTYAIAVSGSKDNTIKLWDLRSATNIHTLHGHKNTVNRLTFNNNGIWLASGSRDQTVRITDVRNWSEIHVYRAAKREVTALRWHPTIERLLLSADFDGDVRFWTVGEQESVAHIPSAHDQAIHDLDWHPIGHMMVTASNDCLTRFWTRNRPADDLSDKYNVHSLPQEQRVRALADLMETQKFNPKQKQMNVSDDMMTTDFASGGGGDRGIKRQRDDGSSSSGGGFGGGHGGGYSRFAPGSSSGGAPRAPYGRGGGGHQRLEPRENLR